MLPAIIAPYGTAAHRGLRMNAWCTLICPYRVVYRARLPWCSRERDSNAIVNALPQACFILHDMWSEHKKGDPEQSSVNIPEYDIAKIPATMSINACYSSRHKKHQVKKAIVNNCHCKHFRSRRKSQNDAMVADASGTSFGNGYLHGVTAINNNCWKHRQ